MKKIGFLLIFISFVLAQDINVDLCGVFTNVLQTRKDPSKIKMKGEAHIINTPGCYLNTGDIVKNDSNNNNNERLICDKSGKDAEPTGHYGRSLNEAEIFNPNNWQFEDSVAIKNVGEKGDSYTVKSRNVTLRKNKYRKIEQDSHHYSFTWAPDGNDIAVYKFDNIANTVTIDNVANKDVKIGQFNTVSPDSKNSPPYNTKLIFNQIPNQIEIYQLYIADRNKFETNMEATNAIDITQVYAQSSVNITLKAPIVRIGHEDNYQIDLSSASNSHIVIYADKLSIGEIDFGENSTLEIHPYTPGNKVKVYIRQIEYSSSSQIIMDSGNYYIKDIDVPDNGNGTSLMTASDNNQIINLIIDPDNQNHDFEIGSNFGINIKNPTFNNKFGENNPINFRIFINGDFVTFVTKDNNTYLSKTKINALIYTADFYPAGGEDRGGEVELGSKTYVRGAISSYNDIFIDDGCKFYWPDGMENEDFAKECGIRYQNEYVCGIFPTPLNSYKKIIINGNNAKVCNSIKISYPENNLSGNIRCSLNECLGNTECERINPPANKYDYKNFPSNSKVGITETNPPSTLTDKEYGDLTFNNATVTLNPQNVYTDNSNIKVMVLGNVNVSKSTLKFEPGDYFFESLTIDNNNNNILLPDGGPVRIFVKKDFNVSLNNFHLNITGRPGNLFIYVGGDFNSIGNGGGTTTLKGFIYVKGNVTLNNNSNNWKIYGALTAEGNININGNNPDFIGDDSADNLGYGKCDICYDKPNDGNGFIFNIYGCPGGNFKIFSDIYVPIKADDNLSNVNIDELHKKKNFDFNFFSKYEVVDQNKDKIRDADGKEDNSLIGMNFLGIMDVSLFGNKEIIYKLGPKNCENNDNNCSYGPTNNNNYQQLHEHKTVSISSGSGLLFCNWYESLVYIGHYEKNDKHYDVIISPCEYNNQNITYTTGFFDAWDTFRNINDRNISTKIVNKPFNLTIASINKNNNATEKKPVDMEFALADENNHDQNITNWIYFNANTEYVTQNFNIKKAYKNVRVLFKVCADYNSTTNTYTLYPYNKCHNQCYPNNKETSNNPCWRNFKSSDNFAIRPDRFAIDKISSDVKAGDDFNVSFTAKEYNGDINVTNYNESVGNSFEVNISENKQNCKLGQFNPEINSSWNFNDGKKVITTNYSEVGDINITIKEVDNCNNKFAAVDCDDRDIPGIWSKNEDLSIKEANTTIQFIPDHFSLANSTYRNFNNSNFTYVSSDLNMSSILNLNITAENEQNDTTKNYNKKCYAQNFDINISHSTLPDKIKIIIYEEEGNSTEFNVSKNQDINFTNLSKEYFTTDNNGTANLKIRINFDKNYSNPVNEFNFKIRDINVSDVNGTFGNKDLKQYATFRYGRIYVKDIAGVGHEVNTTFKYKYWDDTKGWVVNTDHNSQLFGDYNKSKSYYPNDVNITTIKQNGKYISEGNETVKFATTHSLPYSVKIHLSIPSWLWYHPLATKYQDPKDQNQINTDCRAHPCMKVDFLNKSTGWGGIEANLTVIKKEYNVSKRTVEVNSSKKSNVSKKGVKKINW